MALSKDEISLSLRLLERCFRLLNFLYSFGLKQLQPHTQNRSIIIPTHEKTSYHIINGRKPLIKHLHIFGCTCYLTRDGENFNKMKEKGDPFILEGYFTQSNGYRVYNKRTRPRSLTTKASDYDNPDPAPELQNVSPSAYTTVPSPYKCGIFFLVLCMMEFFKDGTSCVNSQLLPPIHSAPLVNTLQRIFTLYQIRQLKQMFLLRKINDIQADFTHPFCTRHGKTRRQIATDPKCVVRTHVSIVERKNIKEELADSAMDRKLAGKTSSV
ncbi:hypothetical protein Tco_0863408 [Tanacetum coccineum]